MARLPVELLRHIISVLSEDVSDDASQRIATLSSVSLASRLCYSLAAPYLYESVEIQDARQAHLYLAVHLQPCSSPRIQTKFLWCGVVSNVLYDAPHPLVQYSSLRATEVSWLQADSSGRYHGFHYTLRAARSDDENEEGILHRIEHIHVVCPDLGRWCTPLFSSLRHLRYITISIYPRGNWDLEASKIERIVKFILQECVHIRSLQIILAYTVAAAGSRMIRMTRAIPVSRAVDAVGDERVTVKSADYMFGKHGWSSSSEVIDFTRMYWLDRLKDGPGPWPRSD